MAESGTEKALKDLKSVLRSIVVSSPTQVDVRCLIRDYRNMMGKNLPSLEYGYRDPLLFLKEKCDDCFVFQGPPSNPVLTLIVPDNLKHIDNFVKSQKLSSTSKVKVKRKSIQVKQNNQSPEKNLVYESFFNNRKKVAPNKSENENIAKSKNEEIKSRTSNQHSESQSSFISKGSDPISSDLVDERIVGTTSNNALLQFLKKRIPLYNNNTEFIESESCKDKQILKDDDDSGRQTCSSTNSSKRMLLEELKLDIINIVKHNPGGVLCTDLIRIYRERLNRELNFSRFGFMSILSLFSVIEELVVTNEEDEWRVRMAKDVSSNASGEIRPRLLPLPLRPLPTASLKEVNADDALPYIQFDPDVFPEDCMHFMDSIPSTPLSDIATGSMVEVIVGEVYSPSHFWLIRLGIDYNIAMEDIMDEMTTYYTKGPGKDRVLATGAIRVGHYCTSIYEGDWHRSLIVKIVDSETVKVRHVDYGTVEAVNVRSLKPLLRRWSILPVQAVRARLAAVSPGAAARRWPHAAATCFLRLVRDRRLVANVLAVDGQDEILEVFLIDTAGNEDVCIGTELIKSGHADPRTDSSLGVSYIDHILIENTSSSSEDERNVRSLANTVENLAACHPNDETLSDISASASEVVDREPRRMATWNCDTDVTSESSVSTYTTSAASTVSNARLARLLMIYNGQSRATSTVTLNSTALQRRLALDRQLHKPLYKYINKI